VDSNFIVVGDYSRGGGFLCYASIETMKPRYDNAMKVKPQSPEYKAFENLLGQVLTVSKVEVNRRIEQDKSEKRSPKSASRVSVSSSKPS
jgi:hypothetical protein